MSKTSIYDGHTRVLGVDTLTDPSEDQAGILSGSVNRQFRGGTNRTRPPIRSLNLSFDTKEAKAKFEGGAISGCFGYNRYFSNSNPNLIVAVNDLILAGKFFGNNLQFKMIHQGVDPKYMHSWFVQVEDRLYWQNGFARPVGWDGITSLAYELPDGDGAMPIGTAMAYCQGRLAVTTQDNFVIISDYIYGNTLTDTRGAEKFFEYQQFNDIGAVSTPAQIGQIVGAVAIPQPGTVNAQGPLLIMCSQGAYALDLLKSRPTWLESGIQTIVLVGRGGASAYALCMANNDVWYQCADGDLSSYVFSAHQGSSQWGNQSLSKEVSKYLKYSDPTHLRFVSMETVHNRILTSVGMTVDRCAMGGAHRFGQGMVACDLYKGTSSQNRSGFAWNGLWTGPNPIQFVNLSVDGAKRSLCVSHDDDGKNRVYEMTDGAGNDELDGIKKTIVSFYDTPMLFRGGSQAEPSVNKRLVSATARVSEVDGFAKVSMEYRPGYYDGWFSLMPPQSVGCEKAPDPFKGGIFPFERGDFHDTLKGDTVSSRDVEQANVRTAFTSDGFRVRVRVEGSCAVNKLQVEATLSQDTFVPNKKDAKACDMILLPGESIFSNKIV